MDTYFSIDGFKCEECLKCVEVCPQNFLVYEQSGCDFDGEPLPPMIHKTRDYTPCHHCDGFWENKTLCQEVCENDAIEISRW